MDQRTLPLNGALIRALREAQGLTVEEAAGKAGYSSRTWQGITRNNGVVTIASSRRTPAQQKERCKETPQPEA